jgi:hypothetical protein
MKNGQRYFKLTKYEFTNTFNYANLCETAPPDAAKRSVGATPWPDTSSLLAKETIIIQTNLVLILIESNHKVENKSRNKALIGC